MQKKLLVLTTLALAQSIAAAEVPSQFIAKQYTEALGRAPEAGGWQGATNYFLTSGACSATSLQAYALSVFGSPEYTNKNYTTAEKVLTAYRAILSREPDASGFAFFSNFLNAGHSVTELVPELIKSTEFAGMVSSICAGGAYNVDGSFKQALDIGAGTWTQAQLQACINNNQTCSVPPRTVVFLNSPLTIPAGKVLETAGGFDHTMYARQARLVRAADSPKGYSPQGILVIMQPGSTVRNIWVSGQRHLNKGSLVAHPPANRQEDVFPNINYVGGNNGTIRGVRSDAPLSGTHIATFPVPTPAIPTAAGAFSGSITIDNNLTTGYAHKHEADGTTIPWADGISNHITNAIITNNQIVDPTDVGIVIFGHDNSVQNSAAWLNTIVHSGPSAYGSLGMDATQCTLSTPCRFTGTGYTNNTIFAGRIQHSDIMLFNGTAAWGTSSGTQVSCAGTIKGCGTGAQMSSNKTIVGDPNQIVRVQVGINVDGMLNATTSANNLAVIPKQPDLLKSKDCFAGSTAYIINATGNGHASGNLQPGMNFDIDGCIGHP